MVRNHGDQINYIYIDSIIEELESDDYTFEQFWCDAVEELAKIGKWIKKTDEVSSVFVDYENSEISDAEENSEISDADNISTVIEHDFLLSIEFRVKTYFGAEQRKLRETLILDFMIFIVSYLF